MTSAYLCQPVLKLPATALANHLQKLLNQLINVLDRFARLTKSLEFLSLLGVKIREWTDKEPHRSLGLKVVCRRGRCQIHFLFSWSCSKLPSQRTVRMGISLSFDFTPELLNV